MRTLLLVVLTSSWAAGCTAAKASIQLVGAEQALTRAEGYRAEALAPYEYTMALRYYEKAKEEAGYSEYRISDALSRQSAEWSDRAIIFIEKRGRTEINLDDFSAVPETAPPAETFVPPPAVPDDDPLFEPDDEPLVSPPPPPDPGEAEPEPEPKDEFEIDDIDDDLDLGPG